MAKIKTEIQEQFWDSVSEISYRITSEFFKKRGINLRKKIKPKGKIASGYIYCPQEFLSLVTGKCYTFSCDTKILSQIEAILIHHRKPYNSFPLEDTQKALNHKGNFILVNCCDLTEDLKPITDYRWFYVPKDFEEAE